VEQYGDWSDEVGRARVVVDFQKANWVPVGRVRVVVYFQLGELGQKAEGDVYRCGGWVEAGVMRGGDLRRQMAVNRKVQVL
jgi:hypothetical protein